MAQRLIYPFIRGMTICGYKTAQYAKPKSQGGHGYPHYGVDISSIQGIRQPDNFVRASGDGTVVWCVKDDPPNKAVAASLGWALAIRYDDCISHGGTVKSLVVRYMHSAKCYVVAGQKVKAGDVLLLEGKVGTNSEHVHMEMDTDTRQQYANWTPQVSAGHSGWVKGEDSTVNPSYWLWQDSRHQQIKYGMAFSDRSWINGEDDNLPFVPAEIEDAATLKKERDLYKKQLDDALARLERAKQFAKRIDEV